MDLLPPIAAGDLLRTSMAEVLAAAFCARATGTIAIEEPGVEKRLFVRYGVPVGVEEPGGLQTFGQYLVGQRLVDEATHERLVAASAQQKKRYGELLVTEGRLSADDVRQHLIDHHQALLVTLCLQREGRYELRGWERPPDWTEGLSLDPLRAVVDALQTDELFERRTAILANLADRPLRRTIDADELLRMLKPGPLERRVVVTLNVPRLATELGSGLLAPEAAEAFACALALLGVLEPAVDAPAAGPVVSAAADFLRPVREESEAFPRPVVRPMPRPTVNAVPARPTPIPGLSPQQSAALDAALAGPYADRPPTGPVQVSRPPTGPMPVSRPPTGPVQVSRPPTGPMPVFRPPTAPVPVLRPPTGPVPVARPPTGPIEIEPPVEPPPPVRPPAKNPRFSGDELELETGTEDEPLELDLQRAPRELVREPPPPPPRPKPPRPKTGTTSPGNVIVVGSGTEPGRTVRPATQAKKPTGPEYNPFAFQLAQAKQQASAARPLVEEPPPPPKPAPPRRDLDLDERLDLAMSEISGMPPPKRAPPRPPPPAPVPASNPDDILAGIADAVGDLPEEGTNPISIDDPPPPEGTPPPDLDLALLAATEEAREISDRLQRDGPAAAAAAELEEIVSDPAIDTLAPAPEDGTEIDISIETSLPPTVTAGPPGAGVVLFDEVRDLTPPRERPESGPAGASVVLFDEVRDVGPARPEPTPAPVYPEPTGPQSSRDDIRRRMLQRAMRNVGAPFIPREDAAPKAEAPEPLPTGTKQEKVDQELEKEVKERLARPANDHFARLDVPHTAGTDEVKEAFLVLAKRFHPDRIVAMGQLDLLPKVRELFGQIKESYDVLVDPASRARHLTEIEGQDKSKKRTADDAKTSFQKAQILLRRKDLKNAEAELVLAVDADPRAEYLAELAWTLLSNPTRRDEAHQQIRDLALRAVKATPPSDRAFVVAGYVARADGEHDKAEKYFRKALEVNPKNVDAGREVRLSEMRRGPEKKPGLLDKLRKK